MESCQAAMNSLESQDRRESLSSRQRLQLPEDFKAVYAVKSAVRLPSVVVCYRPNGLEYSRLGVSVSKKYGNAVRRNRIKRVFRASFRKCQHELPAGYDIVLLPRHGVETYQTALMEVELRRAALKIPIVRRA